MKKFPRLLLISALMISSAHAAIGQSLPSGYHFVDLDLAIGNTEGTFALSFNFDKAFTQKKKLVAGLGARFTSYFGKNKYYITAPAQLTSGSTGPGVIFKENIVANMDTFLITTSQVNSLNLFVTIGYNLSERLMFRFNIDAIGFSFGEDVNGNYINGAQGSIEAANPTSFNLLLISDNDRGSLNSELFARYLLNDKWGIKGGLQFHFTEYTTDDKVQQFPEPNDRFRRKSLMFSAGVFYQI